MASQQVAIERLQMAAIDGRTENIRYRQGQLQALHGALRKEVANICSALARDSQAPEVEVEAEFYLAMEAIRHFYDTLDFKEAHEKEYGPTHGKNYSDRRVGVGLVIIRPASHTRVYSIVVPLAAAMSAGNCVVLELQDSLLEVDAVLRKILPDTLDLNTFALSKTITDSSILETAALVDQTGDGHGVTMTNQLLSSGNRRTVAFVDRTADIEAAAKAITKARFAFGGTSPYAPDLVVVNEFIKREFFEACSKYAALTFTRDSKVKRVSGNEIEGSRKAVQEAEDKRQVSSFGSKDFKLVEVLDKSSPLVNAKISGCYLLIATSSSLVDSIFNLEFDTPLLAGYFFAEPASAKYMAHHLLCHISCLNQIPAQLLVGPAAPIAHDPELHYRYNKNMFTVARPQFVEPSTGCFANVDALLEGSKEASTSTIRKQAVQPLKPTGQPGNAQLGFFEAGFFTGLGAIASVVLPLLGYGTFLAARKGFELVSKMRE